MQIVNLSGTWDNNKPKVSWTIDFPAGYSSCHELDCLRFLNGTLIDTLAPGFVDPVDCNALGFNVSKAAWSFTDDFSTWPSGEQAVPLPQPGDTLEYAMTGDLSDGTLIASNPYRIQFVIPTAAAPTANNTPVSKAHGKKK
jgi:hypothetical protein